MAKSSYHRYYISSIDEMLIRNSDQEHPIASICYRYLGKLRKTGFFDRDLTDAIVQKTERQPLDIYDACIFSQIWLGIYVGKIRVFRVWIGSQAPADSQKTRIRNNLRDLATKRDWQILNNPNTELSTTWKGRLRGDFVGGTGYRDGFLEWDTPITILPLESNGNCQETRIPPFSVPLEIGLTRSTTTAYHLETESGLARWPYGSKWILVFYCPCKWRLWPEKTGTEIDDLLFGFE